MAPCPTPEQLGLLLARQLDEPARRAAELHVEQCPACQARLRQIAGPASSDLSSSRGDRDTLPGLPLSPGTISLPAPLPASPDAAHRLAPGVRLGDYEVLGSLGAGGMGEVYRARDHKLGREVALKVIRPEVADDPERRDRFEREARLLAALNHPGIATLHALEEIDGVRFLVMELVPGQDLAQRLAQGPVPVTLALQIAAGIAAALEAAHQAGIVHRDLKPANIKITPRGDVKLLDFGLARSRSGPLTGPELTREGLVLGTPAYMSPEQARGQPVDPRTDIWAFGCVLYEMLACRKAFARATLPDTLAAVLEHDPPLEALRPATPANVRELVRQCLHKDVSRRLGDLAVARRLLERAAREPLPALLCADQPTTSLPRTATSAVPAGPPSATEALPVREEPLRAIPVREARRPPLQAMPHRAGPRRSWWWAWLLGALLLLVGVPLACCVGAVGPVQRWWSNISLPGSPARSSVVVLPFPASSPWAESEEDKQGEAVVVEVTRLLAQSPKLKVTPHSSALKQRGSSPGFAARFLDVRWVVAGKMQRQGQQLELSIEIIDAPADRVVQTKSFRLPIDSGKAGAEQTAAEIAALVRQALGAD